jgi:hypothetical protein
MRLARAAARGSCCGCRRVTRVTSGAEIVVSNSHVNTARCVRDRVDRLSRGDDGEHVAFRIDGLSVTPPPPVHDDALPVRDLCRRGCSMKVPGALRAQPQAFVVCRRRVSDQNDRGIPSTCSPM